MDFLMGQTTCTPLFAPNVTFIFLLPFFPQFLTLFSLWVSHPKVLQKSSQPVPNFILIILKLTLFMTFNSSRVQPHKLFMLSLYFPFVLLVQDPLLLQASWQCSCRASSTTMWIRKEATTLATTFKGYANPNEGKTVFT